MRVLILTFLVVIAAKSGFSFPSNGTPREVQNEISQLLNFPETRNFIESVEQEGPISLKWVPLARNDFNAFWMAPRREIGLNASKRWETGEKIYSILFELHNAASNRQLNHLDYLASQRQISQMTYVESVEKIEYQNVLKTSQLLERGIAFGYFPRSTYLPEYPEWNEHFRIQMQCGHSAHIAQKYNELVTNGRTFFN